MIDFNHHLGARIADEIQNNLAEQRKLELINKLNPTFTKDGNQFCYLYGENLQEGIAGFGDTPYLAMNDFCQKFYNEKIVTNTNKE